MNSYIITHSCSAVSSLDPSQASQQLEASFQEKSAGKHAAHIAAAALVRRRLTNQVLDAPSYDYAFIVDFARNVPPLCLVFGAVDGRQQPGSAAVGAVPQDDGALHWYGITSLKAVVGKERNINASMRLLAAVPGFIELVHMQMHVNITSIGVHC